MSGSAAFYDPAGDSTIVYLDRKLDPDCSDTDQLTAILLTVLPAWKQVDIAFKKLEGGQVNSVWRCNHSNESEAALIIRIHPTTERMPNVDREREFLVMKKLNERKLIAPVYAKFTNGIIYQYVEGEIFTDFKLMYDPHIKNLILRRLHKIARIPLDEFYSAPTTVKDNIWYNFLLLKVSETYPDPTHQAIFDKELRPILPAESKYCCEIMSEMFARYPRVFCHHDLWWSNLVRTPQDDVAFIDWEMSGAGIEPLELSVLITDYISSNPVDADTEERFQRDWIRTYLATKPPAAADGENENNAEAESATACKAKSRNPDQERGILKDEELLRKYREISDEMLDQWYLDVLRCSTVTSFAAAAWYFWVITMTTDSEECGSYFTKGHKDFMRYLRYKKRIQDIVANPK